MKKGLLICCILMAWSVISHAEENVLLSYQTFLDYVEAGQVKHVIMGDFDMEALKDTKDMKVMMWELIQKHLIFHHE